MHFPHLTLPNVAGRLAVELQHEREGELRRTRVRSSKLTSLTPWISSRNAPTPSTGITVASGSKSVSPWRTWEIDSHLERVVRAYWSGAVVVLNAPPRLWALCAPLNDARSLRPRCRAHHPFASSKPSSDPCAKALRSLLGSPLGRTPVPTHTTTHGPADCASTGIGGRW